VNPLRRGACPGISDPMATGDGLLARLSPPAPIPLDAFVELCGASREHGNGIVEVTQRGSLQVRGLSPATAPIFARTALALGLGTEAGPPLLTSSLLGLDGREPIGFLTLAATLRMELANRTGFASIGPKVSVLIDAGGDLHLDHVPADLRLRMNNDARLHVSIAGNAAAATSLGWIEVHQAVKVVVHVLTAIANRGGDARARDFANRAGVYALRASLEAVFTDEPPPPPRSPAEPVGTHRLNTGQLALGVALPFGYIESDVLKRFALAAARCGAASIRPVPGRTLLIIGLDTAAADELAAEAMVEKLIVRSDDPRRHVVACAGAPACGSALLATRQWAPQIADAAKGLLDGSMTIHVSGCTKGCAHPEAAALTFVGPDRIVVQGRASDAPDGNMSPVDFISRLRGLPIQQALSFAALERAIRRFQPLSGESGRE
jgi:precorrin-3B synthase